MCCQTRDILLLELPSSIIQQSVSSVSPPALEQLYYYCYTSSTSYISCSSINTTATPEFLKLSFPLFLSRLKLNKKNTGLIQSSPGLNYEEIYRLVMRGDRGRGGISHILRTDGPVFFSLRSQPGSSVGSFKITKPLIRKIV